MAKISPVKPAIKASTVKKCTRKKCATKKLKAMKDKAKLSIFDESVDCAFGNMADRLVKIQRDLLMPAILFEKEKVQNTITVFGSARIRPQEQTKVILDEAKANYKKHKNAEAKFALEKAEIAFEMSKYYTAAEELCARLQQWINTLEVPEEEKFYIITGGGPGIMEAANKGANKSGGKTGGLTIFIPDEQARNKYVSEELSVKFNYFLMRKFWLLFFSKALIVFPGGTGTLDEFFEVFTLLKTSKTPFYMPIVLFGKKFWSNLIDFDFLFSTDVATFEDAKLFMVTDTVDEAFDYITSSLSKLFK
ncbi:MAG: LOG family protein [Opitutales bacterium]